MLALHTKKFEIKVTNEFLFPDGLTDCKPGAQLCKSERDGASQCLKELKLLLPFYQNILCPKTSSRPHISFSYSNP